MKHKKQGHSIPENIQTRLTLLEATAARRGIQVHYDRLEVAGLKLKGGGCQIRGEYHLFIDRRKSPAERLSLLETYLEDFPSKEIPEMTGDSGIAQEPQRGG